MLKGIKIVKEHKATFWDFLKSPWRNKLAVLVLALMIPIALFGLFLHWFADRLLDFIVFVSGWVKEWW
jgi:hypothetical protein